MVRISFSENHIYRPKDALELPENFKTYNRLSVSRIEGLCILLKRLAYPCRYLEFISRFWRPVPDYCIIFYDVMDRVFDHFSYLLSDSNLPFLSPHNLEEYANAINRKGAALANCFGFMDGRGGGGGG